MRGFILPYFWQMDEALLVPQLPSIWLFWLLAGGTLAIGLLRYNYAHRFNKLISFPFRNYSFESSELKMDVFNGTLEFWSITSLALALTIITKDHLILSDWTTVIRFALIIGVFSTFQGLMYQLSGYIFNDQEAHSAAWHEKTMFLKWAAIWITPLMWWLSFSEMAHYALIVIVGIFLIILYLWALTRTAFTLMRLSTLRQYHNLLYLCALEISPVLVFIFMVS